MIVHYSNLYAASHNRSADIEPDEIRCFIGILLLSGYAPLPRREMFWENSKDTGKELVSNAMSRNRFRFIMQNIHCNDNKKINPNDKFSKIRPLLNVINKLFIEMAPKEENHSVDESMVPYYGHHGTKQFIRGKPIRWGYKLWTATTRLGYIEWFEPYQGSTTILPQQYKDMGLGASVVLQCADVLVKNYPDLTYHLYFDNFFTSLKLLEKLRQKGIKGTGTIRENRVGKHCIILDSKAIKKKERGFYDYATTHGNEVVVCKWNDNNVVTIASNGCQILPTHNVTRYSQKQKKIINVEQPKIFKKYNENMGGVDRADENISLYRIGIRGKKWYFPLIAHCIDMAEQNSWHLHRLSGGKLDHLNFRRQLTLGILESFQKTTTKGRRPAESLHSFSRYDGKDHLVLYKETQTRCGMCHKKCNFMCVKCSIALHPKNCFYDYHTK